MSRWCLNDHRCRVLWELPLLPQAVDPIYLPECNCLPCAFSREGMQKEGDLVLLN